MRDSAITYNHNLAKQCLDADNFDALTLYYLIKITHTNSVIYDVNVPQLLKRLKKAKLISRNFNKSRFLKATNFLLKENLASIRDGNFALVSLHNNKGYYKSKIKYNKVNINFNIIQYLLVKEGLLHSKHRQEKPMAFRKKMATDNIKTLKQLKFTRNKKNKDKLELLGECRLEEASFTYRKFAEKYGVSIKWLSTCVKWINENKELKIRKITECKHKVSTSVDFDSVKDLFYPNCYAYLTNQGNVIAVLGSSIESSIVD